MVYSMEEEINRICTRLRENQNKYGVYNIKEKDSSFKSLFEVKSQFIELIKTFIKETWVEEITEENIELADKEFVLQNAHNITADIIYRIKVGEKEIYFCL